MLWLCMISVHLGLSYLEKNAAQKSFASLAGSSPFCQSKPDRWPRHRKQRRSARPTARRRARLVAQQQDVQSHRLMT